MINDYESLLNLKAGVLEKEMKDLVFLGKKLGFHQEDDLEVMRPEHFILPACILLGGLTAASITFLCEILYSRKYGGRNSSDNHKDQENTEGTTITPALMLS